MAMRGCCLTVSLYAIDSETMVAILMDLNVIRIGPYAVECINCRRRKCHIVNVNDITAVDSDNWILLRAIDRHWTEWKT